MSRQALLVAPQDYAGPLAKMFGGSYSLGWLVECPDGALWVVWGNSKDRETAKKCVQDVLQKKGQREVLFWDKVLTKELTLDQVAEIRNAQV